MTKYMPECRDARRLLADPEHELDFYEISKMYPVPEVQPQQQQPQQNVHISAAQALIYPQQLQVVQLQQHQRQQFPALDNSNSVAEAVAAVTAAGNTRLASEMAWLHNPQFPKFTSSRLSLGSSSQVGDLLSSSSAGGVDVAQVRAALQANKAAKRAAVVLEAQLQASKVVLQNETKRLTLENEARAAMLVQNHHARLLLQQQNEASLALALQRRNHQRASSLEQEARVTAALAQQSSEPQPQLSRATIAALLSSSRDQQNTNDSSGNNRL